MGNAKSNSSTNSFKNEWTTFYQAIEQLHKPNPIN